MPPPYFIFRRSLISLSLTVLKENPFTIRNIKLIDLFFSFNNGLIIFVRIDNISNKLYSGLFKIHA